MTLGGAFATIAGPCAVETERQFLTTAEAVAASGARMLRGGVFKPRTSPYDFQGLGVKGLELLAKARTVTGLPVVTEVISEVDTEIVAEYADMLQVGSRSMFNWRLLESAARTGKPVLLKRSMGATVEEVRDAAAYLREQGAGGVVLCERGIRTFGTATRNTCDLAAVSLLQRMTGLPVIVDPSHSSGARDLVAPLSRAAVAIGADGLIVEVHPDPDRAWSDGAQSLSFQEFEELMRDIEPFVNIWTARRYRPLAKGKGAA
jgi:3-deoxy-7-phosphoheptulonate synthase